MSTKRLRPLDTVALLAETQGTSIADEEIQLLPGSVGIVAGYLEDTTVFVRFASLDGAAYAKAFVDSENLNRLSHRRETPMPLLLEMLRTNSDFAVGMFEEFWQLSQKKDHDSNQLAQYFLKILRAANPDLSSVITSEQEGEGWKRSLVAWMIMDPNTAKQASLRRLVGRLKEVLRNKGR